MSFDRRKILKAAASSGVACLAGGCSPSNLNQRRAATPTIIASQGGASLLPQNTLAAIENTSKIGAHGSEIDIHLTADHMLALHHDFQLNKDIARGPNGAWLAETGPSLAEMTMAELRVYDVGRTRPGSSIMMRYPDQAPSDGQRISTLEEVFGLYARLGDQRSELWIETKSDPFDHEVRAAPIETFADRVVQATQDANFADRAVVICFDWRILKCVQERNPKIATGYLTVDPQSLMAYPPFAEEGRRIEAALNGPMPWPAIIGYDAEMRAGRPWEAVKKAGGAYWSPYIGDVTPEMIDAAHGAGIKVSTWGAESAEDVEKSLAWGFDSVTTSSPQKFPGGI